ncbi:MAG TPA: hypothetical protein EYO87_04215 [Paracoccus sp.]|nr:hypothetical protein [Paracoccus sp. (in: a-proteobacteria)]
MSRIVTRPEGERKQVTAVFLDLVGFSEVASTSDAEDLQDWLEEYYRRCGEIVEINGGEVSASSAWTVRRSVIWGKGISV